MKVAGPPHPPRVCGPQPQPRRTSGGLLSESKRVQSTLTGRMVRCVRAVRKVGSFSPPVASFGGLLIGMGTHTALLQYPIVCTRRICSLGVLLPCPPLANSRVSARRSPGWGGGRRSPSDGLPGGGGGGDCKGISMQIVVPSTDASKENMCEPTFALMRCQCVSSNTNVIEDPKER